MNKLLSQDEVDALLKGLDAGDIETEEEMEEVEEQLESFDWAIQGRHIKNSFPLLDVVHGRFSQRFRNSLSSALRKMADVSPAPMGTIRYSEFQRSLPVPTSMHLFKMEPLRGIGIMVIESRLVFSLIEAFFGGTGTGSTKIEGRDFTPIEKKIIEKVVQMALINLMEAWEDVHPIKTEFIRSESNPVVVNAIQGEELLLSIKFDIEFNKPVGSVTICTPVSAFQSIRTKLSGGYREEGADVDLAWAKGVQDLLKETQVQLAVDLGKTRLAVRDLLNLKAGDIILLDNEFQDPLTASVEGIPKFEGYAGRVKQKKVFRVESHRGEGLEKEALWPSQG